jgi:Zn-dependent protease
MGIDVYVHWTFWLLLLFYSLPSILSGDVAGGLMMAGFIVAVFACVVAHEFGHAAAAAAFGIPTHDITVLPIGGLARLTRMPDKPYQELVIALAGPAVNVVIVGILLVVLLFGSVAQVHLDEVVTEGKLQAMNTAIGFGANLLFANLFLVVFNLLPAFPMDGGRVLRSLIAMRTSHLRATEIAARIGRLMALLFFVAALVYGQFMLALIALFVVVAGTAELMEARRRAAGPPAWMQWVWTPTDSAWRDQLHQQYTASASPYYRPAPGSEEDNDIIDAVEVREVNSRPSATHMPPRIQD